MECVGVPARVVVQTNMFSFWVTGDIRINKMSE
jgi:hypothetical protein